MFGEFVEARAGEAGRKSSAIIVSIAVQAAGLTALLLAPFLYTAALPNFALNMKGFLAPAVPLVATPKPSVVRSARQPRRIFEGGVMRVPRFIPATVEMIAEAPLPPEAPAETTYEGIDLSNLAAEPRAQAPPAPVAAASIAPTAPQRIRQTEILPAMILAQPQPAYPVLAKQTGIQGQVVLHAIIDREGRVSQLEVVSGHPLLVKAAVDAVLTWRYRPTLLNGQPVEVETTIRVGFVLAR